MNSNKDKNTSERKLKGIQLAGTVRDVIQV